MKQIILAAVHCQSIARWPWKLLKKSDLLGSEEMEIIFTGVKVRKAKQ